MRRLSKQEEDAYRYIPKFNTDLYEKYREEIIQSFRQEYESLVELTDNDPTDSLLKESKRAYWKIRNFPVEQCKDDITEHLTVTYQAVKVELDKYYGPDNELTVLLRNLMIED